MAARRSWPRWSSCRPSLRRRSSGIASRIERRESKLAVDVAQHLIFPVLLADVRRHLLSTDNLNRVDRSARRWRSNVRADPRTIRPRAHLALADDDASRLILLVDP